MKIRTEVILSLACSVIAILGLTLGAPANGAPSAEASPAAKPGLVDNIRKLNTIRAGYGILPPYTQEDPVTHKVTGLSVDIINEIARQLNVNVTWTRFHWSTMKEDVERGDFDVVAEPVYESITRGRDLTFSEPYAYFVLEVGLVKSDQKQLTVFDQLNDSKVRVAVERGDRGEETVKARAPRATVISIDPALGPAEPMNVVAAGKADIAIVDPKEARRFADAHPGNFSLLWDTTPEIYVPAAFAVRSGDLAGADFLNVSINSLRSIGALRALAEQYHLAYAFHDLPSK